MTWTIPALVVAVFEIGRLLYDIRSKNAKLVRAETDLKDLASRIATFHESLVEIENRQQTRYMAMLEQQTERLSQSHEAVTKAALEAILDTREKLYPQAPEGELGVADASSLIEQELDMIRRVESNPREMDSIVNDYLETIRGPGASS